MGWRFEERTIHYKPNAKVYIQDSELITPSFQMRSYQLMLVEEAPN
jgi:hypothetical protein